MPRPPLPLSSVTLGESYKPSESVSLPGKWDYLAGWL